MIAARYGTAASQPTATISICAAFFRIDGIHIMKPYTPMLHSAWTAQSIMTLRERSASP